MDKETQYLEELFQKYRQGLISDEEKKLIARWLVYFDAGLDFTAAELQYKQELSAQSLEAHFFPKVLPPAAKTFKLWPWLGTAAAGITILLAASAIFLLNRTGSKDQAQQTVFRKISTATGQMKILTLSDGTEITLNNESTIRYPQKFRGSSREIFLSGEAFFKVAHNPAKPFRVHTGKIEVQVLGTAFDVRAYPDEAEAAVSVASGKVRTAAKTVLKNKLLAILLPGDQLIYQTERGTFKKRSVDPGMVAQWQKGKLRFENRRLADITRQLERYYRVKFKFLNKGLQNRELHLNVNNQSLEVVMKALALAGEFNYKIVGKQVNIW